MRKFNLSMAYFQITYDLNRETIPIFSRVQSGQNSFFSALTSSQFATNFWGKQSGKRGQFEINHTQTLLQWLPQIDLAGLGYLFIYLLFCVSFCLKVFIDGSQF